MIAVVVPTCRPEQWKRFLGAWEGLFSRHSVRVYKVDDGDDPVCQEMRFYPQSTAFMAGPPLRLSDAPTSWKDLIHNKNDGVRNFGFLRAVSDVWTESQKPSVIITLDDDVLPHDASEDPIRDHLLALYTRLDTYAPRKVPISWFSTASEYMRGFPYGVREEAEVWVSHGVWGGVHDYDGPTQLVNGVKPATFYKGPIPKGCHTPVCGMNLAFRVEALPYVYFSPMGKALGVQRFADIWMGLRLKQALDHLDKAMVSGYSTVLHERASNVFNNLEQEAKGIKWNEKMWQLFNDSSPKPVVAEDDMMVYYEEGRMKAVQWERLVKEMLGDKT